MQACNPFLPVNAYIADGEPHVFGDRVYLYGSHDREAGSSYCMEPYVIWSAPIEDLSNWTNKGISYEAKQDPLCTAVRPHMYAPDCVRGNDGRYYLYYALSGLKGSGGYDGPISVAVCDEPDGKFTYYGIVKKQDGTPFNDVVLFDPAVINDNGQIRLYFGTCYAWIANAPRFAQRLIFDRVQMSIFHRTKEDVSSGEGVMGAFTVTLADDMLTVTSEPSRLFPVRTKGTQWEKHPFFEGSSIRKIGDRYYFIYSSQSNHELCYATSRYPDRGYQYGGTIVSNGDIGYHERKPKDRLNHTGTNHGSIECINGSWYVFYHRQTHGTDYSRQACAERIEILPDGSIPQVEITSCGLNGGPLRAQGEFSAVICCNLTNGKMPHGSNREMKGIPMVTSGNGEQYITGFAKGSRAVYKYFSLEHDGKLIVTARGRGTLKINGRELLIDSTQWKEYGSPITAMRNEALCLEATAGKMELLKFCFDNNSKTVGKTEAENGNSFGSQPLPR